MRTPTNSATLGFFAYDPLQEGSPACVTNRAKTFDSSRPATALVVYACGMSSGTKLGAGHDQLELAGICLTLNSGFRRSIFLHKTFLVAI